MFGGNFPPAGWSFCDGSLLSIAEYETLFNLIGTTYGGDGQQTFALPDLRGRVPVHQGQGPGLSSYVIGQNGGVEQVTLTASQTPAHSHSLNASTSTASPAATPPLVLASSSTTQFYGSGGGVTPMAPDAIGIQGGSQPHENRAPSLAVSFIISLFGIFPSQA